MSLICSYPVLRQLGHNMARLRKVAQPLHAALIWGEVIVLNVAGRRQK